MLKKQKLPVKVKDTLPAKPGHPTAYKPEYCQKIIEYFSVAPYSEVMKGGNKVIEASDFPNFAGFAVLIGHHRETLLNWTKDHPEFFDAYKKAKDLQEHWLMVNGPRRLIDTAFGIFIAKNVTTMRDTQKIEHTGRDGGAIEHKVGRMDIDERVQQIKEAGKPKDGE